jgi:hypothetical protein
VISGAIGVYIQGSHEKKDPEDISADTAGIPLRGVWIYRSGDLGAHHEEILQSADAS